MEKYVTTLKKADFLIKEVSAASIIAKVARDHYMIDLAKTYPNYGFENHVGYGTAKHRDALKNFGPCPEHRQSFRPVADISVQSKVAERKTSQPTSKQLGDYAENIVAEYLSQLGHQIISRNHKTRFYEIDIISTFGEHIYFTEVKYRKSSSHGTSLEMITKKKLAQMKFAAESFLKYSPILKANFSPLLAAASVSGENFHLDEWLIIQ